MLRKKLKIIKNVAIKYSSDPSDRWTTSKIRKRTMVSDVIQKIKKLKWNWIGHSMRTNKINGQKP